MQRPARILRELETSLSVTPEALARAMDVGQRTVASEVASLNALLQEAAQIRLSGGRYRMRVFNTEDYEQLRQQVLREHESFNDPGHRSAFVLATLARSSTPVLIESLAHAMTVGRTTAAADVAHLRRLLAPGGARIVGRPNSGLQLAGDELAVRMAILEIGYEAAHGPVTLPPHIAGPLHEASSVHGLDEATRHEVGRWLVVQQDRLACRAELRELPESHAALVGSPAHRFALTLAARLADASGTQLSEPEVLYLALPVAGRRSAAWAVDGGLAPDITALVELILLRVREVLDVSLTPGELADEFATHVQFMLNRMRYGLRPEPVGDLAQVREHFPLAHRMAEVAREVVLERTGMRMDETETRLVATYFQVFLNDRSSHPNRPFRVGIHSTRGPAGASLLRSQLSKALSLPTEYVILTDPGSAEEAALDMVVVSPDAGVETSLPTLELSEFFDRHELVAKLSRMVFDDFGPLAVHDPDGSMLSYLLDDQRVVRLPQGCDYAEGTRLLLARLGDLGLLAPEVAEEVRPALGGEAVMIGGRLAFPHASSPQLRDVVCALGLVSGATGPEELGAMFLMLVPAKAGYDDRILIRTYEELIRLGTDAELISRLLTVTTYPALLSVLDEMRHTNPGS
ncbi:BglG family transcription antiterminator [Luteococcus peritonei]|uniref:BglG family transcription antiterminator n=1 Tax=Luteococcus peritonei TaxID=88874 RepID=A0ABW4RXZ1_9ACTN